MTRKNLLKMVLVAHAAGLILSTAPFAMAVSQQEAKAEVSATIAKTGGSAEVALRLPDGVKFNMDGPWSLEIKGPIVSKGEAKAKHDKRDFDKASGAFSIVVPKTLPAGDRNGNSYRLSYFVCNKENSWCKRLTAEGSFVPQS